MTRILLILIGLLCQTSVMTAQDSVHVVILGDSNTWIGGDDCDKPQGWNKWFKDSFATTSCKSYARSGATWTNTPQTRRNTKENIGILGNDNVIYNQVCRLQQAVMNSLQPQPQIILIMAGTNDAWFTKARPKVFSMTGEEAFITDDIMNRPVWNVVTLAESVRYNCEILKAAFPKAHIILLTPMPSTAAGVENITKAGDIIEDCGKRLGLNVIRMDQNPVDTTDGTHTSEAGAQQVGTFVAKQLATLLQQ